LTKYDLALFFHLLGAFSLIAGTEEDAEPSARVAGPNYLSARRLLAIVVLMVFKPALESAQTAAFHRCRTDRGRRS
jgi:hypothetical protein